MIPQVSSTLALLFILIGTAAMLVMLELKGNPKDRHINRYLIRTHRILGYLFVGIFIFMFSSMIIKVSGYQEELPPRVIFHIWMALSLLCLIVLKILFVRRYKRLTANLLYLGKFIWIFAVVLNGLTAGYYFLHRTDIKYIAIVESDKVVLDENTGRFFTNRKCGKCHTLERVYRSFKSMEGWTKTVNRMAVIDTPNIRGFDVKQIIYFLIKQQEKRKGLDRQEIEREIGKTLISQKCSGCHDLDRIIEAVKSEDEWRITLERMVENADDPQFLTDKEKKEIIANLVRKKQDS